MKKKYLWWLCVLPIVASPALLALSHCSPLYTSVKEITTTTTTTKYEKLKKAKPSLKTLLYGDKHYNGGNYVVIIGTSDQPTSDFNLNNFLFDNSDYWDNDTKANKTVPQSAPVIVAVQQIKDYFSTYHYDSFAVNTYIEADRIADQDYGKPADNNGKPAIPQYDNLTAFDKFTKQDYLDHNSNNKYKEGNYIRQDKDAKEYRKLANEIKKLFPSVDLSTSKSVALQWVFGYPVASPVPIDQVFAKTVSDNFKTGFDSGWWKK